MVRELGVRIFTGDEADWHFGKPLPDPERLRRETAAAFDRLHELLRRFRCDADRGPDLPGALSSE